MFFIFSYPVIIDFSFLTEDTFLGFFYFTVWVSNWVTATYCFNTISFHSHCLDFPGFSAFLIWLLFTPYCSSYDVLTHCLQWTFAMIYYAEIFIENWMICFLLNLLAILSCCYCSRGTNCTDYCQLTGSMWQKLEMYILSFTTLNVKYHLPMYFGTRKFPVAVFSFQFLHRVMYWAWVFLFTWRDGKFFIFL